MGILQFTSGTNISLESQIERLALEANFLSNAADRFKDILPNLTARIVDLANLLPSRKDDDTVLFIKNLNKEAKELTPKLNYVSFINYNKLLISVPEGFKGNFIDYINTLINMNSQVYNGLNSILSEYNALLSGFITNKDNKISLHDHTAFFKRVEKEREAITKQLAEYFPTNASTSKAYLPMAISRFADIDVLMDSTTKLQKVHYQQDLSVVSKSINKCIDLLNLIAEDAQNNNSYNVSGPASLNIATGSYEVGKYVELMTVYRYKSEQMLVAVDKLIKQLNKVLK